MKALLSIAAVFAAIALAAPAWGHTLAYGGSHSTNAQGGRFITDTLAPGGGQAAHAPGYRFITDTLAPGGGSTRVVTVSSSGFSWADAGVGAGAASGVLVVLLGAALTIGRRRERLAI